MGDELLPHRTPGTLAVACSGEIIRIVQHAVTAYNLVGALSLVTFTGQLMLTAELTPRLGDVMWEQGA